MITYLSCIEPGPISNQGYTHERSIDVEIERDSDRRHVNGTGGLASFVNPAFDKDDIADEHLDSSMARPNANRPGTLRKLLFCNQLRYGKISRDNLSFISQVSRELQFCLILGKNILVSL